MKKRVLSLFRNRALKATSVVALVGLGLLFGVLSLLVMESDPRLAMAPFGYTLAARPFTGVIYSRHFNGNLARVLTVWKGKLEGKDWQWYEHGPLIVERSYRDGREHGTQKTWHPNGAPQSYSYYENGLRKGESWGWHADGTVKAFAFHQDGEEIAIKSFSQTQKPFNNFVRANGSLYGIMGDRLCDRSDFFSR